MSVVLKIVLGHFTVTGKIKRRLGNGNTKKGNKISTINVPGPTKAIIDKFQPTFLVPFIITRFLYGKFVVHK
jgi:hypothetical protein